ncbi:MAG: glycoside hydrolase family 43 protein [Verrucomicrobiota bacterium]|jgi:hypothetical protein
MRIFSASARTGLASFWLVLSTALLARSDSGPLTQFSPGDLWPDNQGVHINAHGGGVLLDNGTYYWYGEHKIAGGIGNSAQVGVHVYSSRDLYNWKDEGIALAVANDPKSDIVKGSIIERPKVLHNAKTGRYVMWFHLELKGRGYRAARAGVAVSDTPTGPFVFLKSFRLNPGIRPANPAGSAAAFKLAADHADQLLQQYPDGQMLRDMNLFVDDDGAAYVIYASEDNATMQIALLSDNFLLPAGKYSEIQSDSREAPALFKCRHQYWLITSACTGWAPNQARLAVADSVWGPYHSLGDPCLGKNPDNQLGPEKTFGGQSTCILPVPGKPGAFIAMFDLWHPDNPIDGRYLWLPLKFVNDRPAIEFKKPWDFSYFN